MVKPLPDVINRVCKNCQEEKAIRKHYTLCDECLELRELANREKKRQREVERRKQLKQSMIILGDGVNASLTERSPISTFRFQILKFFDFRKFQRLGNAGCQKFLSQLSKIDAEKPWHVFRRNES